jgi:uncharacterized protein YdhG (YjbR/CyaY superfamily)
MKKGDSGPTTVTEYIAQFPVPVRLLLRQMRKAVREAAPNAEETISYQIPAYRQNGYLVYFAAFKHHIGFYPTSSGIRAFRKKLAGYVSGRGSVQFPMGKPLPVELVKRIVIYRVAENTGVKRKRAGVGEGEHGGKR